MVVGVFRLRLAGFHRADDADVLAWFSVSGSDEDCMSTSLRLVYHSPRQAVKTVELVASSSSGLCLCICRAKRE